MVRKSTSQRYSSSSFRMLEMSPSSSIILPNRIPLAYVLGIYGIRVYTPGHRQPSRESLTVMTYSPSSGRSSNRIRSSPSMMVAALLPRNLDLGLSSPVIRRPLAGEM